MRLWHWFLAILLGVGLALFFLGYYYIQIGEVERGWELMVYSVFPLGFLLAVGKGKGYYQCSHCAYALPKKEAIVSGWNSEHSSTHIHCPRCGKIIARYVK